MPLTGTIIGVDESGKGDFFGPLVIAAFLAGPNDLGKLRELSVRDSKMIAPNRLLEIDFRLCELFPHAVVIIPPSEYNQRYDKIRNLNKLLAWGHAEAIEKVAAKHNADKAISDKFGKAELIENELARRSISLPLLQIVRGEKVPAVAAASIIARAAFIREMKRLSEEHAVDLPRGAAAQVDEAGRRFCNIHGVEKLRNVAKLHFKNYQRVVNPTLHLDPKKNRA